MGNETIALDPGRSMWVLFSCMTNNSYQYLSIFTVETPASASMNTSFFALP